MLSKLALFKLSHATLSALGHAIPPCVLYLYVCHRLLLITAFHSEGASYHAAKQAANTYQAAKRSLLGPGAPFAGWVVSGEEWESFDAHGNG